MNIMGTNHEPKISSLRPIAETDPVLASGATLGSWSVVKLLGEGGMGRVYLAEHTSIGRRVALKVLKRALARSPELVERFFAEAHAVNRIRHPGIVEVTDCFIDDGGTPCLVMELLEGRTLAEEMAAMRINPTRVAAIGSDVALALDAAHKAGVIHRDLKPDNLFLIDKDGVTSVKVLDFGVAKLMDPMPNSTVHTVAGSIMGTPDYMAPEQLAGKPVDARADIYALGASLYHACTGRPPFQASNFGDLVVMHMTKPPPPPSRFANLPPVLEQVLLAMLEKDPARRPQTMGDVALLLRSAQRLGGALAPLEPAVERKGAAGTAPFVGAAGTAAFVVAPLELRAKVGPVGPPPALPPALGSSLAPIALQRSVANDAPLFQNTPSGTLLLGSADVPEIGEQAASASLSPWLQARVDELAPRPRQPVWAWAAVAGLLFVAVGGGAWAVGQDEPRLVGVTMGYERVAAVRQSPATTVHALDDADAPEAATLASAKLDRAPFALDSDTVRDTRVTSAPTKRVAKKSGPKKAHKANKPAKAASMLERRGVLDPFAKETR